MKLHPTDRARLSTTPKLPPATEERNAMRSERSDSSRLLPPRVIEPGSYRGEIVRAEIVANAWRKSSANPDGLIARIGVEVYDTEGELALVFDAVDVSHTGRLAAAFLSAGLQPPAEPAQAVERLAGCPCRITVKTLTPKLGKNAGKAKSVVCSWVY